jgi:hypothetical protein
MDYELIFWIVSCIAGVAAFGLLTARANEELYVDWIAEWGER